MSDGSNGHAETDEEREWREHQERFDAVRALEKRLSSMESAIEIGFKDLATKFDLLIRRLDEQTKEQRNDTADLYKRWAQMVDLQLKAEQRVAALETKPRGKGKGKK